VLTAGLNALRRNEERADGGYAEKEGLTQIEKSKEKGTETSVDG